jgi:hypothetical protein
MPQNVTIYFKKKLNLHDVGIGNTQRVAFTHSDVNPVRVELYRESRGTTGEEQCVCDLTTNESVSHKVASQFEETKQTDLRGCPPAVRETSIRAIHRMSEIALKVLGILRWRNGLEGPQNPIRSTHFPYWSMNEVDWWPAPADLVCTLVASKLNSGLAEEIVSSSQSLLEGGDTEPLGHSLLREAMQNIDSNPRSSLIVGMAAAEVGLKQAVAKLVPHAEWLAMNVPSPPLATMLKDFIPLLPVKCKIGLESNAGIDPCIPQSLIDTLKKGAMLRNKAAHVGGSVRYDTLRDILAAVKDLLWILDFFCGQPWALGNVSRASLDELQNIPSR